MAQIIRSAGPAQNDQQQALINMLDNRQMIKQLYGNNPAMAEAYNAELDKAMQQNLMNYQPYTQFQSSNLSAFGNVPQQLSSLNLNSFLPQGLPNGQSQSGFPSCGQSGGFPKQLLQVFGQMIELLSSVVRQQQ